MGGINEVPARDQNRMGKGQCARQPCVHGPAGSGGVFGGHNQGGPADSGELLLVQFQSIVPEIQATAVEFTENGLARSGKHLLKICRNRLPCPVPKGLSDDDLGSQSGPIRSALKHTSPQAAGPGVCIRIRIDSEQRRLQEDQRFDFVRETAGKFDRDQAARAAADHDCRPAMERREDSRGVVDVIHPIQGHCGGNPCGHR